MSWDDEDNDWEDQVDEPKKPTEDLWADEDASDDEPAVAGDDWDADPEEKKAEAVPAKKGPPKKKTAKQIAKEREEEEQKQLALKNQARANFKELTLEERRREEERAALVLSADLFGEAPPPQEDTTVPNADNDDMAAVGVPLPTDLGEKKAGIEDYVLQKQPDYEKFAKEVAKKAMAANNSKFLIHFLKHLLTETSTKVAPIDFPEVSKHVTIIANKKAKELSNKKAAKGNKKQLNMRNKGGDDYDDYRGGGGRRGFDSNDYDFL